MKGLRFLRHLPVLVMIVLATSVLAQSAGPIAAVGGKDGKATFTLLYGIGRVLQFQPGGANDFSAVVYGVPTKASITATSVTASGKGFYLRKTGGMTLNKSATVTMSANAVTNAYSVKAVYSGGTYSRTGTLDAGASFLLQSQGTELPQ